MSLRGQGPTARVVEVAEYWDVSPDTVMRLCNSGKLSYQRVGRQVRINWDDVDAYGRPEAATSIRRVAG